MVPLFIFPVESLLEFSIQMAPTSAFPDAILREDNFVPFRFINSAFAYTTPPPDPDYEEIEEVTVVPLSTPRPRRSVRRRLFHDDDDPIVISDNEASVEEMEVSITEIPTIDLCESDTEEETDDTLEEAAQWLYSLRRSNRIANIPPEFAPLR